MIFSMTAFSRIENKYPWGDVVWEIRSVNQRYLETYFRLPEQFRGIENTLREKLRQRLARGKVECFLRFEANQCQNDQLVLNQTFAQQVLGSLNWLKQQNSEQGYINLTDVLRYPGVIQTPQLDMDNISLALLSDFDQLLDEFIAMRQREGEKIHQLLSQRLNAIQFEATKVRQQMPSIIQWQRERILQRFEEAQLQVDPLRLEQEMVFLAQRIDVDEELDRLTLHVKETQRILAQGGSVGRKLDFMMQELNREANTLASKSIHAEITNAAVELKVLIEQMREQIQNVE